MKNIIIKFLFVFSFFLLIGCNKKYLSTNEFIAKMESKNYSVVDLSDGQNKQLLAVGDHYQVYFYEFKDEVSAQKNLDKEVKSLKSEYNNIDHYRKDNYEKYEIVNDNIYTIYSRVHNTYLFISTTKNYRTDVNRLLNYLGY